MGYSGVTYLKAYYQNHTIVGEGLRKCILTENFKIIEFFIWLEFIVS